MDVTGQQIREAREARRWTQERLAAELEVSQRTVGNWERGASVPRNRLGAVTALLGLDGGLAAAGLPRVDLSGYSDTELIVELARRLGTRVTVHENDRDNVRHLPTVSDQASADPLLLAADRGPNEGARRRAELDRLAEHPDEEGPEHGA